MLSPSSRQTALAKLSTRLVSTNPEKLSISRCTSRRAATTGSGLEGSGRLLSSAGDTLAVPLIDDGALVAGDAGL